MDREATEEEDTSSAEAEEASRGGGNEELSPAEAEDSLREESAAPPAAAPSAERAAILALDTERVVLSKEAITNRGAAGAEAEVAPRGLMPACSSSRLFRLRAPRTSSSAESLEAAEDSCSAPTPSMECTTGLSLLLLLFTTSMRCSRMATCSLR